MREVKVTWKDIYFLTESLSLEDLEKTARPALQATYGQLLVSGVDYIVVVSTIDLEEADGEPQYRDIVAIPRGCIVEIKDIS